MLEPLLDDFGWPSLRWLTPHVPLMWTDADEEKNRKIGEILGPDGELLRTVVKHRRLPFGFSAQEVDFE